VRTERVLTKGRTMTKKAVAVLAMALLALPVTAGAASANDPLDSNVVEKVECMLRVYVNEGGENGLDCLT
jgi:hypothetical protein